MRINPKHLIPLLTLLLLLPTTSANAIYDGVDAINAPNVVSIVKEYSNGLRYGGCSGALISARIVVTAAHCVTDDQTGLLAKNVWVSPPGAVYKPYEEDGKNYQILSNASSVAESRAIYEQYLAISIQITSTYESSGDYVNDNDVAFVVLKNALPFTSNITIASDEETESFITNKSPVRIYGYGKTSFDSGTSLTPKMAVMNFDSKSTSLKNSAYIKSASSSACPGDSGGPVIVSTAAKLYLVGVITGGSTSTTGPACNNKIGDSFFTLIALITKYSNLAFTAAVIASQQSDTAGVQAVDKAVADAKAAAEAAAKIAQDKAVADAKATAEAAAKLAQDKALADAKSVAEAAAKLAQDKALADAKSVAEAAAKIAQDKAVADAKAAAEAAAKLAQDKAVADAKAAAEAAAKLAQDKAVADAKAAAEAAAKLAQDKALADAKAASDKAVADAKSAAEAAAKLAQDKEIADKVALIKSELELAAANASLADSQKVNRDLRAQLSDVEGQLLGLSASVSTIQTEVLALNTKLSTTLKSLSTANAKIKKICAVKPKPKGC